MGAPSAREACAVVGVFHHPQAARVTRLALHALQHRGRAGWGLAAWDGRRVAAVHAPGPVACATGAGASEPPAGLHALGHVCQGPGCDAAQPVVVEGPAGGLALALVGLPGGLEAAERRAGLAGAGGAARRLAALVAASPAPLPERRAIDALRPLHGACTALLLSQGRLVAVRDPRGYRPLVLGRLGAARVVASETCALELAGAEFEREVAAGEVLVLDDEGVHSHHLAPAVRESRCAMELLAFARPDSTVFGRPVWEVRHALGRALARERPVAAELVVPVPDAAVAAALGYAERLQLPFAQGLVRHAGLAPAPEGLPVGREPGARLELGAVRTVVEGRRLALVADGPLEPAAARAIVALLREAGAREVHLRLAAPPTRHPCPFGTRAGAEPAPGGGGAELARALGADSAGWLSLSSLGLVCAPSLYCDACLGGGAA